MLGFSRTPCDTVGKLEPSDACSARTRLAVLVVAILGSSMAFIDGSVVGVALPAMQSDLGTTVTGAQWINNAYMLTLGALILVGGAAGDRFGLRRVFAVGVAIFAVASAACGLAPGEATLIAARAVQGVGGALLVPSSLALISAHVPEAERGRAIGTWAGASALTTALGPVLGGWLVDLASWRLIFLVNLPIAVITLALLFSRVPRDRRGEGTPLDWAGALLAVVALGALAYALTASSELGWSHPAIVGSGAAAAVASAGFLWWEGRASHPMMPLGLFRSRAFSGANLITLLLYFALSGALFFVPFNLIQLQGYSAAATGAAFLPFTLIFGVLSRWAGGFTERYGARAPLTLGPIVCALGFALFALPGIGGSYWTTFLPPMVVLGLGMAIAVAPLTTTVMGAAEERHAGVASGINNAVARVAGLLAVALLGAIAVAVFAAELDGHLAALYLPMEEARLVRAQALRLAEAQVPPQILGEERAAVERAFRQSFLASFRVVALLAAALAFASGLAAFLLIEGKRAGSSMPID